MLRWTAIVPEVYDIAESQAERSGNRDAAEQSARRVGAWPIGGPRARRMRVSSSSLCTAPAARPSWCVVLIAAALTSFGGARTVADDSERPIRDVTPPGVIRVYRDVDAKNFLKDATWFTKVRVGDNGNVLANG